MGSGYWNRDSFEKYAKNMGRKIQKIKILIMPITVKNQITQMLPKSQKVRAI